MEVCIIYNMYKCVTVILVGMLVYKTIKTKLKKCMCKKRKEKEKEKKGKLQNEQNAADQETGGSR